MSLHKLKGESAREGRNSKHRESIERKLGLALKRGRFTAFKKRESQEKRGEKVFNNSDIPITGFEIY